MKLIKSLGIIKKEKQKFLLFINIVFLLAFSVTLSCGIYGGTGLNVMLLNQNPDPVSPGNYLYLNVKVANFGSDQIQHLSLKLLENSNIKIADGYDKEVTLGPLSAFSSNDETSFAVVKYKVFISPKTPPGFNNVNFLVKQDDMTTTYKFNIFVENKNPNILIDNVSNPTIKPGSCKELSFQVKNPNKIQLSDININLGLNQVENKYISVKKSTNEQIVDSLNSNKNRVIKFQVCASPDADSKPYLLPIDISYKDNLENHYNKTLYTSIDVYSNPDLSLMLYSQDSISNFGEGKIMLGVANPGSSSIKGVITKILNGNNYQVTEGANQYIGDLNPDDFQTIQGKIKVTKDLKGLSYLKIKVQVFYKDSYGNDMSKIVYIPLRITPQKAKSSESNFLRYLIVALISSFVTFLLTRQRFAKKIKKLNKRLK